ncbi:MAG: hypothetical protein NWE88_08500 [Candidatus Bathyarchaeota archaeon]|nr:hypothetical protein [Candidatus Bathyarchaeota archaeon]
MQTGLQAEALLCPNCKEEVPKTLYCLNCGYPLYKIEVESAPMVEEDAPEPVAIVEAEAVEEEAVEVAPEPQVIIEPEVVQEEIVEIAPELPAPIVVEEEVVETVLESIAVVEAEPVEEDVVVLVDSVEEIEAPVEEVVAEPEIVEPVVEEIIDFEPVIEPVANVNAEAEEEIEAPVEEVIVVAEEPEPVEVEEVLEPLVEVEPEVVAVPEYEPDPVINEVMGNLAKNISMKIKLVDLLRTGGVKSEIFRKLFDSYLTRGELLMNSRSDMLERVRYDLGSMEGALHEAREGLEELDIRRAIEDVSEEEYAAKAPGFQWDIGQYKDEVGKKQADIYYLEDITRVMSSEEIGELVGIGEGCFEVLDELTESEGIDGDTAAKIRVSLEEALACIR